MFKSLVFGFYFIFSVLFTSSASAASLNQVFEFPYFNVIDAEFTPDEKYLVLTQEGSSSGGIRSYIINTATWTLVRKFEGPRAGLLSPLGRYFVHTSYDSTGPRVYETQNWTELRGFDFLRGTQILKFTADDKYLFIETSWDPGAFKSRQVIINTATGEQRPLFEDQRVVDVSPDGKYFSTSAYHYGIVDVLTLKEQVFPAYGKSHYEPAIFDPSGKFVVINDRSVPSDLNIYQYGTWEPLRSVPVRYGSDFKFSERSDWIVVSTPNTTGPLKVVSTRNWKTVLESKVDTDISHGNFFSPDDKFFMLKEYHGQLATLKVFSTAAWTQVFQLEGPSNFYGGNAIWSPDSQILGVTGKAGEPYRLYDTATWNELATIDAAQGPCRSQISPNGKFILIYSYQKGPRVFRMP